MLKNGQIAETEIVDYTSDGQGVCRIDGCAVFVPNAIRGEVCEVKVVKAGKNTAVGKIERIMEAIHGVLERTPPELVADISNNGIVMTGGGSLISGFDKLVESRTGIHTVVAEDAISCVAEGTGKSLESLNAMTDGTVNLSRRKQMN